MKYCALCVKQIFKGYDYIYFITIKPPPDKFDKINQILMYLEKKSLNCYWLVSCMSTNGYLHYHGLISFINPQSIDNRELKAIHRQVNRVMGFCTIDPLRTSIGDAFSYIRDRNNTNNSKYEQNDDSDKVTSHCTTITL